MFMLLIFFQTRDNTQGIYLVLKINDPNNKVNTNTDTFLLFCIFYYEQ
jgi:hypothetical protein